MTIDLSLTPTPVADGKRPMPLVLQWESWQARLVRKAEILHALGKPCIMVIRLGDCPPHWFKTIPEK